jgi:peptide/nickel transport system permease protein
MLSFALQRLAVLIATLFFASVVVFAVMNILPGDAAQTMLGPSATPGSRRASRSALRLR